MALSEKDKAAEAAAEALEKLAQHWEQPDLAPALELRLLEAMRNSLTLACGGTLNKVSERICALEMQLAEEEAHHVTDGYGPDIVGDNGARWEHKGSRVLKKNGYKSNWNYAFDPATIVEDVRRKMEGGGIILQAFTVGANARTINTYRLDWRFWAAYVTRYSKAHPTSRALNVGRTRCTVCEHYHYAKRLEDASADFLIHGAASWSKKRPAAWLTDKRWTALTAPLKCNKETC